MSPELFYLALAVDAVLTVLLLTACSALLLALFRRDRATIRYDRATRRADRAENELAALRRRQSQRQWHPTPRPAPTQNVSTDDTLVMTPANGHNHNLHLDPT